MSHRVLRRLPIFSAFFRSLTGAANATTLLGLLGISWGTYTPTQTNVANLSANTAFTATYVRIGSVVISWGQFAADAVAAAGTATQLDISLPIASNLANQEDLIGVCNAGAVLSSGRGFADTTNDRASFAWLSQTTANQGFSYFMGYLVK